MPWIFLQRHANDGGSKTSLLQGLDALRAAGAHCLVVTGVEGPFTEALDAREVPRRVHALPGHRKWLGRLAFPFAMKGLSGRLRVWLEGNRRAGDPDELFVVANELYEAPHAGALARRLGGRSAAFVRDANAIGPRARKYHLDTLDRVLCVNPAFERALGLENARTVLNPIAAPSIEGPAPYAELPGPARRWILWLGKASERKDPLLAVDVLARLDADGARDTGLALVGGGPEEILRRVRERAAAHGLSERVRLVGPTDAVGPWIRDAALLLLSSRREGLPRVLVEALALGRPAVTPPLPGLEAVFGPLTSSCVAAERSAEALAARCAHWLAPSAADRERLEERAAAVRTAFAPESWPDRLRQAFRSGRAEGPSRADS